MFHLKKMNPFCIQCAQLDLGHLFCCIIKQNSTFKEKWLVKNSQIGLSQYLLNLSTPAQTKISIIIDFSTHININISDMHQYLSTSPSLSPVCNRKPKIKHNVTSHAWRKIKHIKHSQQGISSWLKTQNILSLTSVLL